MKEIIQRLVLNRLFFEKIKKNYKISLHPKTGKRYLMKKRKNQIKTIEKIVKFNKSEWGDQSYMIKHVCDLSYKVFLELEKINVV